MADTGPLPATTAPVRIELRQDRNTPPAVFAVETATGRERMLWESNPDLLNKYSLGRVEEIHWKNGQGQPMTGVLYYPVHFAAGRRFPLVLYPCGNATGFSLDAAYTTAYAAQPLANQDIAVLTLRWWDGETNDLLATPKEAETAMANCESAIEYLAGKGWIDRDRVGLTGFSRPGWYVEHMLAHSRFPFAAAIAADNMSTNYTVNILTMSQDGIEYERDIGAAPFGQGLETWVRTSPAFNAEHIHTPLRLETDSLTVSGAVVGQWEMFAQLRRHRRPVELYVVPDSEHGSHPLQNPRQRLASQGGAVDWFDFWLNGHERTEPVTAAGETKEKLAEQYARWHKLRKLHEADVEAMKAAGRQ
jgi:dipeptidyl aminopeptidase/acylaminoacyl peptidase